MRETIIALSGGVDSGVAASLLLGKGDRVRGLFMRHRYQETMDRVSTQFFLSDVRKESLLVYSIDISGNLISVNWTPDNFPFPLPIDAASAINVAKTLGIQLILLDVDGPFAVVVENFVAEYFGAHTPNPCVLCNREIKFGLLWNVTKRLNADVLATGHYVRVVRSSDWLDDSNIENQKVRAYFNFERFSEYDLVPEWLKNDSSVFFARSLSEKDQTYFLYNVNTDVLSHVEFPVGKYSKDEVRRIAVEKGLPVAVRKDSQEVCFVPDKQRLEFIHEYRMKKAADKENASDTSGNFVSLDGKVIGRHVGYEKYTVGQRKGLGMGFGERIFVQQINSETHDVVLGPYEALGVSEVHAVESNWHLSVPVDQDFRCEVKVRYRNESSFATVRVLKDGSLNVKLDKPRYGIAPGQSLVCYWKDRLLGGGRIVL